VRKRVLIVAAISAVAVGFSTTHAGAIPVHHHYMVTRVVRQGSGAMPFPRQVERMRVVNVAPTDSDQDGVKDTADPCPQTAGSGGGCPPPPPPAPVQPVQTTVSAVTPAAPAPAPATSYPTTSGDYSNVPGVPSSFAACVAMAESTNGTNPAAGGNVYGILDPVPGTDPVGDPQGAMAALYAQSGPAAWAPYDGC
jgi:hypothetical protein